MRTEGEFQEFCQCELGGFLYELEERRRAISKSASRLVVAAVIVFFVAAAVACAVSGGFHLGALIVGVAVAAVVGGLGWAAGIKPRRRAFVYDFKRKIIHSIVKFIDENLDYNPSRYVSSGQFMRSTLFRRTPDRYRGEDHVSGTVDGTRVEFSEIHAEYETRDDKGRVSHHTIFRGIFLVADFHKEFKGTTVVLPDVAQKMLGFLGQTLQKWNLARGELIKLEDPEFEKEFVVYGDDQIEARYILTTSMMERLLEFTRKVRKRREMGGNVYLAFTQGKIFVAIDCRKDLFEPNLFASNDNFDTLKEYFETMSLAIGVLEDLKLNPRFKA